METHYRASWSTSLIVVSALATVLCLGGAISLAWNHRAGTALLPLALVLGAAPFAIRGYSLGADAILVHRLFWTTRLPRTGLTQAEVNPQAMRGSLRTFGNGGFFSITGLFWSRPLGAYRAFVTNPRQSVVLHYGKRILVVSPDQPEDFVQALRSSEAAH